MIDREATLTPSFIAGDYNEAEQLDRRAPGIWQTLQGPIAFLFRLPENRLLDTWSMLGCRA